MGTIIDIALVEAIPYMYWSSGNSSGDKKTFTLYFHEKESFLQESSTETMKNHENILPRNQY